MHANDKIFANVLNYVPEFGPKTLAKIRHHFGSYKNAWEAEVREFLKIPQLEKKALFSLEKIKKEKDPERGLHQHNKRARRTKFCYSVRARKRHRFFLSRSRIEK